MRELFFFKSSWTIPLESVDKELLGIVTIGFYDYYTPDIITVKNMKRYSKLISFAIELLLQLDDEGSEQMTNNKMNDEKNITVENIKKALTNSEFVLYYQPYFSLKYQEIGIEALIRWQHPKKGLLLPRNFPDYHDRKNFRRN